MGRVIESNATYFCDSCFVEKDGCRKEDPESMETCVYRKPYICVKKDAWLKHIKTEKHIKNVATNNNIKDEYINECPHCHVRLDDRSYHLHRERNKMLWVRKGLGVVKECSCNNFITNGRRFNNIGMVSEYYNIKENYSYGTNNINYKKFHYDKAVSIIKNKEDHEVQLMEAGKRKDQEMMEAYKKKKAIQEKKEKKEKAGSVQPTKEKVIDNPDLIVDLDETPVEKQKRERLDCNIPPVFDDDDACTNCGLYQNFIVEYPEEKLERYNIKICECGEDSE
jgi:hypothetical protein